MIFQKIDSHLLLFKSYEGMNAFPKLAHLPQKYCIFYAKQLRLTKIPLITTLSRHQKAIQRLRNCCEMSEDKNLHQLNDANLEHVFLFWVLSGYFCMT